MKEQRFYHDENNSMVSIYRIYRDGETLYIENDDFSVSVEDQKTLNKKFFMNIRNTSQVIDTILDVFKAPIGGGRLEKVTQHNEAIDVIINTERNISSILVSIERDGGNQWGLLMFNFDRGQVAYEPEKRKPTPAMVWVMKELTKEYKAWEKEQKKK